MTLLEFYQEIADYIAEYWEFTTKPKIELSDELGDEHTDGDIKYRTRGTCFQDTGQIVLYKEGQNIETLLHEIAHLHPLGMVSAHGPLFNTALEEVKEAYNDKKENNQYVPRPN